MTATDVRFYLGVTWPLIAATVAVGAAVAVLLHRKLHRR